jgi:riboflavin biosynthesis pyrimidine reductase
LNLLKVTCEGGPSLLSQLLVADVVDEYDLTISPITVGGISLFNEALPQPIDWKLAGNAKAENFEFQRLIRQHA